jgi:two-component system phosphate regulon sensor histidine kinase PhoR
MKHKTQKLIILVIFFLISLIIIQFIWIIRAAGYQEKQFEYTVVAALNKSVTELDKQNSVCLQVTNCFDIKGFTCCEKEHLSLDKWTFIDSLIKAELAYSKICLPYEFQLTLDPHPHPVLTDVESRHKCFTVKSNLITTNNEPIWLHITFPGRNKFILAQIGWLFIVSIVLIVLTIGAFLLIYKYYRQEQSLSNDTRNFINNLTHEFKTPLASIRLANNRISKTPGCAENVAPYTRIIKQENDKLDLHINYLLDISRMQKGKMPMNFEVLDLHQQIRQVSDSFQLMIDERKGSIKLELLAQNFRVKADCFHISNAINNLLDNACKYSPQAPDIVIKTFNKNHKLVVAISDKGLGIDKADQKTIFQEFSRVNTGDIHNVKGFGLGLSYVGQVVQMHQGYLELQSKKGEGSTFFIELPIFDSANEQNR